MQKIYKFLAKFCLNFWIRLKKQKIFAKTKKANKIKKAGENGKGRAAFTA